MISSMAVMNMSTPAPAIHCHTDIEASSAGAAARPRGGTSGGCSASAASIDSSAAVPKFDDAFSAVVCSVGDGSLSFGSFESGGDVKTLDADSLDAASARGSELSCDVGFVEGSRFGDSAWRTFKPSGARNQQRRLAVRSTR